jgi:hypothetical protein
LSRDTPNDDVINVKDEGDYPVVEKQDSRPQDLLIIGQRNEDVTTIDSSVTLPTSPVEKKIKRGMRMKKLNQQADEWLFSLDQER